MIELFSIQGVIILVCFVMLDIHEPELYSEPNVVDVKTPKQEDYAEPVDSLQASEDPDELLANPIYEGIYSEPLYGIAGTILVGPQVRSWSTLSDCQNLLSTGLLQVVSTSCNKSTNDNATDFSRLVVT